MMHSDYNIILKWSHDHGLVINHKKTNLMMFRKAQDTKCGNLFIISHNNLCLHTYMDDCNCEPLKIVDSYVYLGVTFDSLLNFNLQIVKVRARLRSCLKQFSLLRYKIPKSNLERQASL